MHDFGMKEINAKSEVVLFLLSLWLQSIGCPYHRIAYPRSRAVPKPELFKTITTATSI